MHSIEDSEVDRLEKKNFADLVMAAKSVAGFLLSVNFEWTEYRHINTAWLLRQFQNGGLRSRFFRDEFLPNSGHFKD